jgi:phosphoribosylamine---glycine ligase
MNVLLVGSGGREHAIAKKIIESNRLKNFYCIPGNPGIEELAEIHNADVTDIKAIVDFAKDKRIDLIIAGPEGPLVLGLADEAEKAGIAVFGPKKCGAILEGSKEYSKNFMHKYGIPTADYKVFDTYPEAKANIEKRLTFPVVIKADGLAAGKGVKIALTKEEALSTLNDYMVKKIFGDSGNKVLIEEVLSGEEMSFFYITDSKTFLPLLPAKDYKRALDADKGENTGGMGSYAPHLAISDELKNRIEVEIVEKVKTGFKKENIDYRGVLFIGLMLTAEGPKVIEFNCRFGDPETQVILPLIDNDFLELLNAAACGRLNSQKIKWRNDYAACVVIASGGYPGSYKKGVKINFKVNSNEFIHAGTKYRAKEIVTDGGRVLNAVALGMSKQAALDSAYRLASNAGFDGAFYRKDIGK